jgi:hypothetical protein
VADRGPGRISKARRPFFELQQDLALGASGAPSHKDH